MGMVQLRNQVNFAINRMVSSVGYEEWQLKKSTIGAFDLARQMGTNSALATLAPNQTNGLIYYHLSSTVATDDSNVVTEVDDEHVQTGNRKFER